MGCRRRSSQADLTGKGLEELRNDILECCLHTSRSTMELLGKIGKIDSFDGTHPGSE